MATVKALAAAVVIGVVSAASSFQAPPFVSAPDQAPLTADRQTLPGNLKAPLVSTKALQESISKDTLHARAESLYKLAKLSIPEYNRPTRVIGSAGHAATLQYIYERLSQLKDYYELSQQPFPAYSGSVFESRLVLGPEVIKSASPFSLTPPTKNKEPVYGDLVLVDHDGCNPSDYPRRVKGNIAFIRRGACSFGAKSALAGRAGAAAAVVYNNEQGPLHGTMGTPEDDHIATFGMSLEEAEPFVHKLKGGDAVDAIAYIDAVVKTIVTDNIVAQTLQGDPENCVMLGAHSDSVPEGPGINDDGSGTLSLLEIATQLTNFSVNNCVRFAWWSAEEEGLLGSDYYASNLPKEQNLKIRLFMDYDMLASPNFAYQIYNATNADSPTGSEELRDLYVEWYQAHGLNYSFIPFDGRSDYDGFIRAGIPAGGIATGAEGIKTPDEAESFGGNAGQWYDPCYHQLCDDVGNNNMTAWVLNTKLVAHSVATYALSFDGFPKRTNDSITAALAASSTYGQTVKYHGNKLYI